MGSGCEAVHETVDFSNSQSKKLGVLKVGCTAIDAQAFVKMLPANVRRIARSDRTKGAGSGSASPLSRLREALSRAGPLRRASGGGRYGLSSKEFYARDDQSGVRQSRATYR